jgi:Flp pilus assembly protein TadD
MGMTYYRRGNLMAARDEFRRAAIDAPYNADYRHNLAMAMKRQGDIANAEQNYRQALELNPTHQPSYHGLAMLMNEQGRQAEADQLMQAYVDTQPFSPGAHVEMAWLKQQRGDYAAAERSLQQAIDIKPNHPIALAQLGQLYEQTGQTDRAAAMYRQSLKSNWYQPRIQSRLASVQRPNPYGSQFAHARNGAVAALPGYGPTQVQAQRVAWDYPLPTYDNPMSAFAADLPVSRTAAAPQPALADEQFPTLAEEPAAARPPVVSSDPTPVVTEPSDAPAVSPEVWEPATPPSTNSPEDPVLDADPAHSGEVGSF